MAQEDPQDQRSLDIFPRLATFPIYPHILNIRLSNPKQNAQIHSRTHALFRHFLRSPDCCQYRILCSPERFTKGCRWIPIPYCRYGSRSRSRVDYGDSKETQADWDAYESIQEYSFHSGYVYFFD